MTDPRLQFLFGADFDPEIDDVSDPEARSERLASTFSDDVDDLGRTARVLLGHQIFLDDPPELWQTVERLRAAGLDREQVFGQLELVYAPVVVSLMTGLGADDTAWVSALARLPLPTHEQIGEAATDVVRAAGTIDADQAVAATLERVGLTPDEFTVELISDEIQALIEESGTLVAIAGGRLAHRLDLAAGLVLTHTITDDDVESDWLDASFDLAGLLRPQALRDPDGEIVEFDSDGGSEVLCGDDGWISDRSVGTTVAVSIDDAGTVHIEDLDAAPPVDAAVVALVREAYDRIIEDGPLPVTGEELVFEVRVHHPDAFLRPEAPLTDLVAAAGLDHRGHRVAHEPAIWAEARRDERRLRLEEANADDPEVTDAALRVLVVFDLVVESAVEWADGDGAAGEPREVDVDLLRTALIALRDEYVLSAVADELFTIPSPDATADASRFIDALGRAASKPVDRASVLLLGALSAELSDDPVLAEERLEQAHAADPESAVILDRLAWYASDRGDAAKALRLWAELEPSPGLLTDLAVVESFGKPTKAPAGRNDPCPCGSGRKYKQCHLGTVAVPPLPDRVRWIVRKAVAFLERRGGDARDALIDVAQIIARPGQSFAEVFEDPLVFDLALTEGGWFETFLSARGALLPADEAELAAAWVQVRRTIYEIESVERGAGVVVRDLRTDERLTVRDRTFGPADVGTLLCARAVPDGESHQFIGAIVPVGSTGDDVDAIFEALDTRDPGIVAAWLTAR